MHDFKNNVMAQAVECKSHHKLWSPWGSSHLRDNYVHHSLAVAQKLAPSSCHIITATGTGRIPGKLCLFLPIAVATFCFFPL